MHTPEVVRESRDKRRHDHNARREVDDDHDRVQRVVRRRRKIAKADGCNAYETETTIPVTL